MFDEAERPSFGDLPQGLVRDMLDQSLALADGLQSNLARLRSDVVNVRRKIGEENIRSAAEVISSNVPTSCGVDGSYVVERLLSSDLAAFAVLAIEGITPPSERRHWPEPRHTTRVFSIIHEEKTQQILRGLMMSHELRFAREAPHDVVMLDYGLRTPIIYLNNATSVYERFPHDGLKGAFAEVFPTALSALLEAASGRRSDKIYVGAPKYSTLREMSTRHGIDARYDDKTLATLVLKPGEFVGPLPIGEAGEIHLTIPDSLWKANPELRSLRDEALAAVDSSSVLYYKPRPFLPAFRLEAASGLLTNRAALGTLLRAVEFQTTAPGVFEPFPLYLADRMVKHLGGAFPAFLQTVVHEMACKYEGDSEEVLLAMHSYRSEGGR